MNIMRNRFYLSLIVVMSLISMQKSEAQIQTLSPYSSFGLGDVATTNAQHFVDMGGTALGMYSTSFVNTLNPASYSNLTLTNFEIGAHGRFTKYEQGNQSTGYNEPNFSHLTLGADVGPKGGIAFGFIPYSNHGYEITNSTQTIDFSTSPGITDTIEYNNGYEGTGGVNKIFVGGSYKINNNLSFGTQIFYYFGNLIKNQEVEFNSSSYASSRSEEKFSVKDFGFNFGLQYSKILNDKNRLTLGATFTPKTSLKTKRTNYKYTYKNTNVSQVILDTVENFTTTKGDMEIPLEMGFGFSYENIDKWVIGADLKLTQWADARYFNNTISEYKNEMSFNIGGSYTPNKTDVRYFWKRIEYRGGFKYKTGKLDLSSNSSGNLTSIDEIGINFGLGIPMRKTNGTLNLGFEIGQRGTINDNLIKETYFKTYIAFNFRDKWFIKRKID